MKKISFILFIIFTNKYFFSTDRQYSHLMGRYTNKKKTKVIYNKSVETPTEEDQIIKIFNDLFEIFKDRKKRILYGTETKLNKCFLQYFTSRNILKDEINSIFNETNKRNNFDFYAVCYPMFRCIELIVDAENNIKEVHPSAYFTKYFINEIFDNTTSNFLKEKNIKLDNNILEIKTEEQIKQIRNRFIKKCAERIIQYRIENCDPLTINEKVFI
jgi:hypothetical protein